MPVNSILEPRKGVEKGKFSLSLNRNNVQSNECKRGNANVKENSNPNKPFGFIDKEKTASKRPFSSTYNNTLNASKRLKPLSDKPRTKANVFVPVELIVEGGSASGAAMLNGHNNSETSSSGSSVSKKTPIATLSNLGNTCFLNSVLYTLRYAPCFLHNLHHLVSDLSSVEQKLGSIRLKSSSLGRSAASLASSGTRSWSSKDLLSLGQSDNNTGKSKIQVATEKLHETYSNLRTAETKCVNSTSPDPYAADAFLSALRDVNSTFEGNRQQDAHELLICILNNIRETCRALSARAQYLQPHENGDSNGLSRQPSLDVECGKGSLGNIRKSWKKRKEVKPNERRGSPSDERAPSPPDSEKEEKGRPGWDFVAEQFEGTTVMRTMCVECETVNEHRQPMFDIGVPMLEERDDCTESFKAHALTTEYLRDQNKYWCDECLRYVEARRSVSYARLPRLLVVQLKRFSGGMEKITRHAPTPTKMTCFCETCIKRQNNDQPTQHRYTLWAVIMHLGQSLSGGHYVAYARDSTCDYKCEREGSNDVTNTNNTSSSFMRTLFNRPRPQQVGCVAKDCCVPRQNPEPCWLACDDEIVKPITNEEFEDLLSAEPKVRSAATPYLLFYVKSEVG